MLVVTLLCGYGVYTRQGYTTIVGDQKYTHIFYCIRDDLNGRDTLLYWWTL